MKNTTRTLIAPDVLCEGDWVLYPVEEPRDDVAEKAAFVAYVNGEKVAYFRGKVFSKSGPGCLQADIIQSETGRATSRNVTTFSLSDLRIWTEAAQ